MLETGKVVGDIEADSYDDAVDTLVEFLGGRPMIWELRPVTNECTK